MHRYMGMRCGLCIVWGVRNLAVMTFAGLLFTGPTAAIGADPSWMKILPADGTMGQIFGISVAVDESRVIVGSFHDDDNGSNSGSAYIFDKHTGAQIVKLLPEDGEPGDEFGVSVAIDGSIAIVGAWRNDDHGSESGSAYMFDTTTGKQLAKLLPKDLAIDNFFGISVALEGSIAVVGAPGHIANGTSSGAVYIFDATTGKQLHKLLPIDASAHLNFGHSVAIDDSNVVMGAPSDHGANSAYIFDALTGSQLRKLEADDGGGLTGGNYGVTVAISGTRAIVGANLDGDYVGEWSGSAYLFDVTSGVQLAKLLPNEDSFRAVFGSSIAISGSIAIVGAPSWADSTGLAYLFDATTGAKLATLLPDGSSLHDDVGCAVAIHGSTAVIGAWGDDEIGSNAGAAYIVSLDTREPVVGDLDGNGSVGVSDLLILLANWGDCVGCPLRSCLADFDSNCSVGVSDLLVLLGNWG